MSHSVEATQQLLHARVAAFKAIETFLQTHRTLDTPALRAEFERLRAEAEVAVQAFDETLVG